MSRLRRFDKETGPGLPFMAASGERTNKKGRTKMTRNLGVFIVFLVMCLWILFINTDSIMEIRPQPIRSHPGVPRQELASMKRQKVQDKIHKTWLLDKDIVSKAKHKKTLAGDFLDNLLDSETVLITMQDPYDLLEDLIKGKETAFKVVKAFCKRAVTAHQIVCLPLVSHELLLNSGSCLYSSTLTASLLSKKHRSWTSISSSMVSPKGLYMAYPLASKTRCTSRVLRQPWAT
jgi:hypothetical protein